MRSRYHHNWQTYIMYFICHSRENMLSPNHVLEANDIYVRKDLSLDVKPVRILDKQIK